MKMFYNWDEVPLLLSVKDVANILGIGQATAYSLVNSGTLPRVKIGKNYKVSKGLLRQWLEKEMPA
jgi:excisionase family DNA binding protein